MCVAPKAVGVARHGGRACGTRNAFLANGVAQVAARLVDQDAFELRHNRQGHRCHASACVRAVLTTSRSSMILLTAPMTLASPCATSTPGRPTSVCAHLFFVTTRSVKMTGR